MVYLMIGATASLRIHLQRVHVEEMLAVPGHSADDRIVQGPLHHVGVSRFRRDPQHSLGEEDQSDRRAGLRIYRVVRQVVIKRERFALRHRAYPAGNVHLFADDIVPQLTASRQQGLISSQRRHVGHPGQHVEQSNGMPYCRLLFPYRLMRLMVSEIDVFGAPSPMRFPVPLLQLLLEKERLLPSLIEKIST
ncbi:hypothetical protein D3C81_882930 [compost metagenome]